MSGKRSTYFSGEVLALASTTAKPTTAADINQKSICSSFGGRNSAHWMWNCCDFENKNTTRVPFNKKLILYYRTLKKYKLK